MADTGLSYKINFLVKIALRGYYRTDKFMNV